MNQLSTNQSKKLVPSKWERIVLKNKPLIRSGPAHIVLSTLNLLNALWNEPLQDLLLEEEWTKRQGAIKVERLWLYTCACTLFNVAVIAIYYCGKPPFGFSQGNNTSRRGAHHAGEKKHCATIVDFSFTLYICINTINHSFSFLRATNEITRRILMEKNKSSAWLVM